MAKPAKSAKPTITKIGNDLDQILSDTFRLSYHFSDIATHQTYHLKVNYFNGGVLKIEFQETQREAENYVSSFIRNYVLIQSPAGRWRMAYSPKCSKEASARQRQELYQTYHRLMDVYNFEHSSLN